MLEVEPPAPPAPAPPPPEPTQPAPTWPEPEPEQTLPEPPPPAPEPEAPQWPPAEEAAVEVPPPAPLAEQPDTPPPIPETAREDDGDAVASDYDDAPSSFDYEPPFRPRRNPAKMWTMAALVFALVALAAMLAVMRYGLPDWVPFARTTFAEAQSGLVLDFPRNRQERRTLPNGTEYFGANGTITNVGAERRSVPSILIVLRDTHERIVYSWEVSPPKRQLAPGESMTINEAVTDVPKSAKAAEIGWKPG